MIYLKNIILFLVGLFLIINKNFSQDLKAGEINVSHISGYTYEAKVKLYHELSTYVNRAFILLNWGDGSGLDTIYNQIGQGSCGDTNTITKNFVSIHTYSSTGNYIVSCIDSFRVSGINNINNSINEKLYLQYNLVINPFLGVNNSIVSLNCAVVKWWCCNWVYNSGSYDVDGDSLSYSIVPPYTTNYSFPSYTINNITGDFTLSPSSTGKYAICMKIDEWRSIIGLQKYYIGSTYRELLIEVPSLSAINEITNKGTDISFFPNPLSISTTLQSSKPLQNASLFIYDMLGKEVKSIENLNGTEIIISIDGMNSGMYFFTLTDKKGFIGNGKLIIE